MKILELQRNEIFRIVYIVMCIYGYVYVCWFNGGQFLIFQNIYGK